MGDEEEISWVRVGWDSYIVRKVYGRRMNGIHAGD